MYFGNYGLRKTQLDKCLKTSASQYLLTSNMVNESEHCFNPNDSIFTIGIDYCEEN